jgi:RNA polymerase sigma-70 factor (ECF subfamily)
VNFFLAWNNPQSRLVRTYSGYGRAVTQQLSNDAEIVTRLVGGDREGFVRLYDQYSGLVYGVALRVLRNAVAAQDIVQDVFLQLWRNPGSFDPARGRLAPWLAVITRHKAVDSLRKHKFEADPAESPALQPIIGEVSQPSFEEAELAKQLMAQLPAEQRQVLELAYLDGMTHVEIADRLGQPLGTIKSRIRLGLLFLRKELAS